MAPRPQFMRIAVLLGLVAGQRYQPGLGALRRDRRLFARSRSVIQVPQARHRPSLARRSAAPSDDARQVFVPRQRTWLLPIAEQHRCPRHPACRFGPRPRRGRPHIVAHARMRARVSRRSIGFGSHRRSLPTPAKGGRVMHSGNCAAMSQSRSVLALQFSPSSPCLA